MYTGKAWDPGTRRVSGAWCRWAGKSHAPGRTSEKLLATALYTCGVRSRSPHNAGYSTSNCTSACISYIRTVCAAPAKQHRHIVVDPHTRKKHTRTAACTHGKRMRRQCIKMASFRIPFYRSCLYSLKPRLFPSSHKTPTLHTFTSSLSMYVC